VVPWYISVWLLFNPTPPSHCQNADYAAPATEPEYDYLTTHEAVDAALLYDNADAAVVRRRGTKSGE
jgi:hypothetical protein